MTDADLEMHFIRVLSVGGLRLSGDMRAEDRRERIRLAIFTQHLERKPVGVGGDSWAQAFQRCYGRPLELRQSERDAHGRPRPAVLPEEDEGEEEL